MTEEEITWKMPKVDIGFPVKVFPNGRDDGKPHLAFVARVNDRSIDIKSPLGTSRGGVRFINDPCMVANEGLQREYGAWDFTDETKSMMDSRDRIKAMEDRIATLEAVMESPFEGGTAKKK